MELIDVTHTGEVIFVKDVIEVDEDVLHALNAKESRENYTFVDKFGDGQSHGFDRQVIIFEHNGHLYKTLVLRYFGASESPLYTFTRPFRVFSEERTTTHTVYSPRLTQRENEEEIIKLKEEVGETRP